jgi:hypothetical protein
MVQPRLAAAAQGRHDAALASYGQALARGVEQPRRRISTAPSSSPRRWARRRRRARAGCGAARNPRFVAAWVHLGSLHEQRGDRAAPAMPTSRRSGSSRCSPWRSPACRPAADRRPDDPLIVRAARGHRASGAARPTAPTSASASARRSMRRGAYDEAFAAYVAANAASRSAAGAARYDRLAHEGYVDRLIAALSGRAAGDPPAPAAPRRIFICGMFAPVRAWSSRSLASHPQVTAGG